jgi:hypothetical protein
MVDTYVREKRPGHVQELISDHFNVELDATAYRAAGQQG